MTPILVVIGLHLVPLVPPELRGPFSFQIVQCYPDLSRLLAGCPFPFILPSQCGS